MDGLKFLKNIPESGINYAHKKKMSVGDIIEVEGEIDLFKITKISATMKITAITEEGYKIDISRSEVRFNHKNNINF